MTELRGQMVAQLYQVGGTWYAEARLDGQQAVLVQASAGTFALAFAAMQTAMAASIWGDLNQLPMVLVPRFRGKQPQ